MELSICSSVNYVYQRDALKRALQDGINIVNTFFVSLVRAKSTESVFGDILFLSRK